MALLSPAKLIDVVMERLLGRRDSEAAELQEAIAAARRRDRERTAAARADGGRVFDAILGREVDLP